MKTLVIVESPTKAEKIQKFLGKDYIVMASKGHITDLIKGGVHGMGIDIDNNFKPKYTILDDKIDLLNKLMASAKQCDQILIASDPDREGEAIAWHLKERLIDLGIPIKRFTFHEITKKAINASLKNLRDVDVNLFHSQEARRILDRIVGFSVSPFLINFFGPKLSAGRVQSVVTKMIIDREIEIDKFNPEDFWTIQLSLSKDNKNCFIAKYESKILDKKTSERVTQSLNNKDYVVYNVVADEEKKYAPPPLITATLQQNMSRIFGISADKTMRAVQSLYENGYCTYIRTDSVRAEPEAINDLRSWLASENMEVSDKVNIFKNKDASQDAHECIRPTSLDVPYDTYELADPDQKKAYELIWKYFVASQMQPAIFSTLKVFLHVKDDQLLKVKSSGKALKEPGFLKVLDILNNSNSKIDIPILSVGENVSLYGKNPVKCEKKSTQPPPRFSESDLIEELKKKGIGRPATYADILSKITNRDYVLKNGNVYRPTDLGKKITKILSDFFPFMDYDYTANLEKQLDEIAENKINHIDMLNQFYNPFKSQLQKAYLSKGAKICNKCSSAMILRNSRAGNKFWGCTNYPKCNGIKNFEANI